MAWQTKRPGLAGAGSARPGRQLSRQAGRGPHRSGQPVTVIAACRRRAYQALACARAGGVLPGVPRRAAGGRRPSGPAREKAAAAL